MKKILLTFLIFLSAVCAADVAPTEKSSKRPALVVRGCGPVGFFAEFLWTLNYLEWCQANSKTPIVQWGQYFAYYSAKGYNGSKNCWEYYFEPVSNLTAKPYDKIDTRLVYNNYFSAIWEYSEYINNMYLLSDEEKKCIKSIPITCNLVGIASRYPKGNKHIYSRDFRIFVKEQLLDKFVKIKPNIQEKIDAFYRSKMEGKRVIGIHLRGKFIYNEVAEVPIEVICEEANQYAGPNTVFLVATDQTPLLEAAKSLLNGEVIYYDTLRKNKTTSPQQSSQWHPKMGEEVLIDAKLLSLCDHFIHTISSVSTAVLYFNPDLPHTMLYCGKKD